MYHAQHLICTKPVNDHNAKNAGDANHHQILFMFYRVRRVPCLRPRKMQVMESWIGRDCSMSEPNTCITLFPCIYDYKPQSR